MAFDVGHRFTDARSQQLEFVGRDPEGDVLESEVNAATGTSGNMVM